jgi:hypothetical protein
MMIEHPTFATRVLMAAVVVAVVYAALYLLLPYSPDDFRRIHTTHLVGDIKNWQATYGSNADARSLQFSRKDRSLSLYETNIVHDQTSYRTFVRFDAANFCGRGYLVATREPRIFWIGRNGKVLLMYPKEKSRHASR